MRRDCPLIRWLFCSGCFNPRACMRRDTCLRLAVGLHGSFNPRACMRRDIGFDEWNATDLAFQSTRLHEARPEHGGQGGAFHSFQSTRLHEARRHRGRPMQPDQKRFNPRACMRRDEPAAPYPCCRSPFQSTRLHEARRTTTYTNSRCCCFNPRACMRRDLEYTVRGQCDDLVSIHAPA